MAFLSGSRGADRVHGTVVALVFVTGPGMGDPGDPSGIESMQRSAIRLPHMSTYYGEL